MAAREIAVPDRHSVLIYGAGAVGGYLGAKLTRVPDVTVTLLGRDPLVHSVAEDGLTVIEDGTTWRASPEVVSRLSDRSFDLVLLCTRTYDVPLSLPNAARATGPSGCLLLMQNGLGTDELVVRRVSPSHVIAGTVTFRLGTPSIGVVERFSQSGGLALARVASGMIAPWVERVFADAGLAPSLIDDSRSLRWSKLLLNMMGSAACAVLDTDMAEIVGDADLFRIEQLAFREASRVMRAQGIRTVSLPGYPVSLVAGIMRLPRALAQPILAPRLSGSRGGQPPGMRADLRRGRTEIDAYNGAIVREADVSHIRAPVNRVLTEAVHACTRDPDVWRRYRQDPAQLVQAVRVAGVAL